MSKLSSAEHRKFFAEFCKWEKASGGPDSQLPTVAAMSSGLNTYERVWRLMCYMAVYNVPYGEVLWTHWPFARALKEPMRPWLDESFAAGKITTRIERRSCRRADWMDEYFAGARQFVLEDWDALFYKCSQAQDKRFAYEIAWSRINMLPRVGRYAALKLIEYMRRFLGLQVVTPDIRPKDAWSPRHTLGYIFPDRGLGNRDNTRPALDMAHQSCIDAISMLHNEFDVEVDMFELQVLLCEYRESVDSKKQYPGRSLDSELKYAHKAQTEWAYKSDIWDARHASFPKQHLGEIMGWEGTRKEVGECLATHHYTWTDLVYDYAGTKDLRRPIKWGNG